MSRESGTGNECNNGDYGNAQSRSIRKYGACKSAANAEHAPFSHKNENLRGLSSRLPSSLHSFYDPSKTKNRPRGLPSERFLFVLFDLSCEPCTHAHGFTELVVFAFLRGHKVYREENRRSRSLGSAYACTRNDRYCFEGSLSEQSSKITLTPEFSQPS